MERDGDGEREIQTEAGREKREMVKEWIVKQVHPVKYNYTLPGVDRVHQEFVYKININMSGSHVILYIARLNGQRATGSRCVSRSVYFV